MRADAEDEPFGKRVQHLLEILECKRVPLAPTPVAHDPVWQHDQVPRVFCPVDRQSAKAVVAKPRHAWSVVLSARQSRAPAASLTGRGAAVPPLTCRLQGR